MKSSCWTTSFLSTDIFHSALVLPIINLKVRPVASSSLQSRFKFRRQIIWATTAQYKVQTTYPITTMHNLQDFNIYLSTKKVNVKNKTALRLFYSNSYGLGSTQEGFDMQYSPTNLLYFNTCTFLRICVGVLIVDKSLELCA